MAAAQRLTDPQRTSPAANTPGRLVSSGGGSRGSGQLPPGSLPASLPVIRYPAVLVTNPIPAAPSVRGVRGTPPMQLKKASASNGTGSVLSPEPITSLQGRYLRSHAHINIRDSRHLIDEVLRHRRAEVGAADQQRDLLGV